MNHLRQYHSYYKIHIYKYCLFFILKNIFSVFCRNKVYNICAKGGENMSNTVHNLKSNVSLYSRILLLLGLDIIFVLLSSFFAMLIRMEFNMQWEMWTNYMNIALVDIIITIAVYSYFNLYMLF